MTKLINYQKPAEARLFALLLTFSGGFIDAFTYIKCGRTMAAAQTGNIIFLSAAIANHNFIGVVDRLSALVAFVVGLAMVSILHANLKTDYWRVFCLLPILIIGAIIGLLPDNFPDYFMVPAVSFGLAMQSAAFSKIEGLGYNSVFTSGSVKKATVAWSEYYFHHDQSQRPIAFNYLAIVLCFTGGAIISAQLLPILRMKTIWIATLFIIITDGSYYLQLFKNKYQQKSKRSENPIAYFFNCGHSFQKSEEVR